MNPARTKCGCGNGTGIFVTRITAEHPHFCKNSGVAPFLVQDLLKVCGGSIGAIAQYCD
jgi:hypothetical protein